MVATVFDYNGVLVDDERVHFEAMLEVLGGRAHFTYRDYVEKYLGFDDVGAFHAILRDAGTPATDGEVSALVQRKKPVYMRHVSDALTLFEGAKECVRRRAARGPVAIVSGALRAEIELGLERLGVSDAIAFIVSAEDTQRSKPDPEGYLLAKTKLTGAITAVEDSLAGVSAAKAAGLRCVAVAHSYDADSLRAAGADAVAQTIALLDDAMLDG